MPYIIFTKEVNLNDIVNSSLDIVASELKFHCVVSKNLTDIPNILCDKGEFIQVIVNLLMNASQAIKKKDGHITINTYAKDDYVFVDVIDNGEGISKEHVNRIFDPFFTTKDVGQGTGLGLSIVYNIIQKHHAYISVESEVGKMTKITIKIRQAHG